MSEGFTVFFETDIGDVPGDPFQLETPFGRPVIIGRGDVFVERDELEAALEGVRDELDGEWTSANALVRAVEIIDAVLAPRNSRICAAQQSSLTDGSGDGT